jgi:hypothetical protein
MQNLNEQSTKSLEEQERDLLEKRAEIIKEKDRIIQ